MLGRLTAVVQDLGVVAAGFFKRITEDGKTGGVKSPERKNTIVVDALADFQDRAIVQVNQEGSRDTGRKGLPKMSRMTKLKCLAFVSTHVNQSAVPWTAPVLAAIA